MGSSGVGKKLHVAHPLEMAAEQEAVHARERGETRSKSNSRHRTGAHLEGLLPKPKRSCGQPCPQNDTRRKLSKFEEARTADMAVRPSRAFGQQALDTVLNNSILEVELVALLRVAPRSAAQRTRERFRCIQRPIPDHPLVRGRVVAARQLPRFKNSVEMHLIGRQDAQSAREGRRFSVYRTLIPLKLSLGKVQMRWHRQS
jgi:hypothetical protein